jgi:uncharacterized protein YdaU (DUF1376 family)
MGRSVSCTSLSCVHRNQGLANFSRTSLERTETMANPWSAFYWRDYVGVTGHLTLEQHGAYLLLMAHYYMTGRPLPANASVLHRVCRCTSDADRSAVNDVLAEFFRLDGDVYRHSRIDRELAKAIDISEKRRAAANAKHHKTSDANAPANASANAHTTTTTITIRKEKTFPLWRAGGIRSPTPGNSGSHSPITTRKRSPGTMGWPQRQSPL